MFPWGANGQPNRHAKIAQDKFKLLDNLKILQKIVCLIQHAQKKLFWFLESWYVLWPGFRGGIKPRLYPNGKKSAIYNLFAEIVQKRKGIRKPYLVRSLLKKEISYNVSRVGIREKFGIIQQEHTLIRVDEV
jgi:hypothetical protein